MTIQAGLQLEVPADASRTTYVQFPTVFPAGITVVCTSGSGGSWSGAMLVAEPFNVTTEGFDVVVSGGEPNTVCNVN